MSELKATTVYDAYWKANSVGEGTGVLVYLKSEADKVIADKDAEIADLIEKNKRLANKDMIMASETIKGVFDALRHQKYKRCLAMAMWCWAVKELNRYGDQDYMDFAEKWRKRWLELAEKFKEGVK